MNAYYSKRLTKEIKKHKKEENKTNETKICII